MQTVLFFSCSDRHACGVRMDGINRVAFRKEWHVQIVDNAFDLRAAKEAIAFWNPIGIIAGSGSGTESIRSEVIGNTPVVYFDVEPFSRGDGVYVNLDDVAVGRKVAGEFVSLGLENFVFVEYPERRYWNRERCKAFSSALEAEGKSLLCSFPCRPGEPPLARRKRLGKWLSALPRPCGVFAVNDQVAEEVLVSANMLNISVPHDLAVIGVDDNREICLSTVPTLTSLSVDFEGGAQRVAELLADMIEHPRRKMRPRIEKFGVTGIVRRGSTMSLKRVDHRVSKALEFIRCNVGAGLSVADVVAEMKCSRRMAEMRFRTATGKTILSAINDACFDRACDLLKNPKLTAGEVADRLGGLSSDTLRRLFIDRVGVPPREWRKAFCAE